MLFVDPNGMEGIIYLVDLQQNKKIDTEKLIAETNKQFEEMGLETRMQLAPDGKDFNPNYMDKTDAMAVLGDAGQVKDFIAGKSADNAKFFNDWEGGSNNPERSTNPNKGATMNIIALDAGGFASGGFQVDQSTYGAFLTMHGAGHNARMGHSDEMNPAYVRQHPNNAVMMCSGNYFGNIKNAFASNRNGEYIKSMQSAFGTTRSDNYSSNRRNDLRKVIHY
jgi:hypothetical protein